MERLTKWIDDGETRQAIPDPEIRSNGHSKCCNKLAELEDLEKRGLLLRLPCRPNDIVYRINKAARVPIIKMVVKRIVLFDKSYALEVVDEYGGQFLFLADDIGKVLYITREEAEAKLAEMEESHD
nr:MAG TPA: hypothetical protein [Caudoviricetes sp.]